MRCFPYIQIITTSRNLESPQSDFLRGKFCPNMMKHCGRCKLWKRLRYHNCERMKENQRRSKEYYWKISPQIKNIIFTCLLEQLSTICSGVKLATLGNPVQQRGKGEIVTDKRNIYWGMIYVYVITERFVLKGKPSNQIKLSFSHFACW